ncbi:efflux RND transporter periplasmic adaptor subunit [Pedobacter gandavensis]|uniref:efflux RND transporter periplasmic adaptor subunit n=1 Tax=Pedobacter gandavensis TaxID=2679963 RepID=UPI00247A9557|nr:efflux RND transporter periplasmic adaptor subunit [Pedobacter gandavensis]WGQ11415.1 efflux RND transporter periplasmic adaptor subunit [Pedobacter gandavensis]
MKHLILSGSLLLFLASCAQKKEADPIDNYQLQGDTLVLPTVSKLNGLLHLDTVAEAPFQMEITSVGKVKAIPNFYAEIASPFSGRLLRVFIKLGMKVSPGTPLFELASPDFIELQQRFFSTKAQLKKAGLDLKRQNDLFKNEVSSVKDLEEVSQSYNLILSEYTNLVEGLKVYHVVADQLKIGQPFVLRSPIKGEVIQNDLVTGGYLNTEAAAGVKIAELSRVYVAAQVKEKDIRFIHKGDEVRLEITADPGKKIKGKVGHIAEILDEESRSIQVLIECENPDAALKPEMYAKISFKGRPVNALFIPEKAVFQQNDSSFVFLQTGKGRFVRRTVETGGLYQGKIMITKGLKVGDVLVASGAFYLLEAK